MSASKIFSSSNRFLITLLCWILIPTSASAPLNTTESSMVKFINDHRVQQCQR